MSDNEASHSGQNNNSNKSLRSLNNAEDATSAFDSAGEQRKSFGISSPQLPIKSFTQQKLLLQRQLFLADDVGNSVGDSDSRADVLHVGGGTNSDRPASATALSSSSSANNRPSTSAQSAEDREVRRKIREASRNAHQCLNQSWHFGIDPMQESLQRLLKSQNIQIGSSNDLPNYNSASSLKKSASLPPHGSSLSSSSTVDGKQRFSRFNRNGQIKG